MTYEEAIESRVTLEEGRRELIAHGVEADILDNHLFAWEHGAKDSTMIRFSRDASLMVSGREILDWLGY